MLKILIARNNFENEERDRRDKIKIKKLIG